MLNQVSIKNTETFADDKAGSICSNLDESSEEEHKLKEFIKSDAEKRLVWKLNYTLMPFVGACVIIQFIDKSTLGISAVLGIIQDTRLTGSQYSWLGSLFSLGYICCQLPNNYLMQKLPISKYLGTLMVLWGIVMGCTALCNNFAQLAVCRVLLGVFESGTYPCLLIIINTVYRRSEQSAAYGFFWVGSCSGLIVGTAVGYGIAHIGNANGIQTWRWLYIIWGALTVLIGILVFFFLPDTPNHFMFRLNEEEKELVKERIKDNAVVRVKDFKLYQVWEAVREPRLWLLCLSTLCNHLHAGGLMVFSTIIVHSLGFTGPDSILLQIPGGFIASVFSVMAVYIVRKSGQLYLAAFISTSISLVGVILLAVLPNTGIKLIGYFLAWSLSGTSVVLLTITAADVTGYTKKIFYNSMNQIAYTLGTFIGPLVMLEREAPIYKTGMIIYCVGNGAILVMLFGVRQLMARQNKKRLANPTTEKYDVNDDLTDKQNKSFIYKL